MKTFEQLKEWEVAKMRTLKEANARLLLSHCGAKLYKSAKEELRYFVGQHPKIGRVFIYRIDYPNIYNESFLASIGFCSSKKWGLKIGGACGKPFNAKNQSTLREAYNFARELILKAQAGEPIQKYLLQ